MSSRKIATIIVLAFLPAVPVAAATTLSSAHHTLVSVSVSADSTPTPTATATPDDTPWG